MLENPAYQIANAILNLEALAELCMPNQFKSTWKPIPRSERDSWKCGVVYEVSAMPDEIDDFGAALIQRFPGSLIYSSRIHARHIGKSKPMQSQGETETRGKRFGSLLEAGQATNAASAFFRQPWPVEVELGDEGRLMNYREELLQGGRDAFLRMGRCLEISWWAQHRPLSGYRFRERRETAVFDCEFDFIVSSIKFNFIYDSEDPIILSFLSDLEAFLSDNTTCDFASYDPCTHEVINPARQDASQRRSPGVVRYASLNDRTYFGWCHRNGRPPEVMGPRPEVRAAFRREAGLNPDG